MRALGIVAAIASVLVLMHCGTATSSDSADGGGGGGGAGTDGAAAPGTDGASPGNPSGPSGLPCAVDAVLAKNCRSCHQNPPLAGAVMPLMTWDDLQAPAKSDPTKKVYELVSARIKDDTKPMPPPPNTRLSGTDTTTIDSWIAAGTPKSTDTCTTSNPDGGLVDPLDCVPDVHLKSTSPWAMPQDKTDEYVCYGYDVTSTDPKHIIAFAPNIDNTKIVHHALVFQSDTAYPTVPQDCQAFGDPSWRIIFGWAPGGKNMYLPPQAGFPISAGTPTHYVVQIHYNNINGLSGQTDSSGIDACTSAPRQYEADVVAFGTQSIKIPANSTYDRTCSIKVPSQLAGKTIFSAMPHMHTLGSQIDTHLTPLAGGANVDLGTVTNWSFQNQYWQTLSAVTATNDTITTHCQWKNTTGAEVDFGENTENEMCYSFTMYYPKVTTGIWNWAIPAVESTCQ